MNPRQGQAPQRETQHGLSTAATNDNPLDRNPIERASASSHIMEPQRFVSNSRSRQEEALHHVGLASSGERSPPAVRRRPRTAGRGRRRRGRPSLKDYEASKSRSPPKPKRPLCAYNFFFQEQRKVLLAERSVRPEGVPASGGHGKMGFSEMGKAIAAMWNAIEDPADKRKYDQMALMEKRRYEQEMAVWNRENDQTKEGHKTRGQQEEGDGEHQNAGRSSSSNTSLGDEEDEDIGDGNDHQHEPPARQTQSHGMHGTRETWHKSYPPKKSLVSHTLHCIVYTGHNNLEAASPAALNSDTKDKKLEASSSTIETSGIDSSAASRGDCIVGETATSHSVIGAPLQVAFLNTGNKDQLSDHSVSYADTNAASKLEPAQTQMSINTSAMTTKAC